MAVAKPWSEVLGFHFHYVMNKVCLFQVEKFTVNILRHSLQ